MEWSFIAGLDIRHFIANQLLASSVKDFHYILPSFLPLPAAFHIQYGHWTGNPQFQPTILSYSKPSLLSISFRHHHHQEKANKITHTVGGVERSRRRRRVVGHPNNLIHNVWGSICYCTQFLGFCLGTDRGFQGPVTRRVLQCIRFIQGIHRSFNSWLSLVVIAITDLTVIRAAAAAPRWRWKIKPVHGSILDKWPCGFRAPFTLCQSPNQWIYSFHLYFNTYPKRSRKRVPFPSRLFSIQSAEKKSNAQLLNW